MTRNCPVCTSSLREVFHRQQFTDGETQEVCFCLKCGMPYAWKSPVANYDQESKYAVPNGCGSGENPTDVNRNRETAEMLARIPVPLTDSILDIGCARGGLLRALNDLGYTKSIGMDPSANCVAACCEKGLAAVQSTLQDRSDILFDCVVLSHVLEHCWDVPNALYGVRSRLRSGGRFYIEVPDASRYTEFLNVPYLDFNREHINHFDICHLRHALMNAGLDNGTTIYGRRELVFPSGKYPAIYAIGKLESYSLRNSLLGYMNTSHEMLIRINDHLRRELGGDAEKVIVWGYGEFLQRLAGIQIMQSLRISRIVDGNPSKHGIYFNGRTVTPPVNLPEYPIIVASIVNQKSIVSDIKKMNLPNKIVVLS